MRKMWELCQSCPGRRSGKERSLQFSPVTWCKSYNVNILQPIKGFNTRMWGRRLKICVIFIPGFKGQKGASWERNAKYVGWARRQNKSQLRETAEANDRHRNDAVGWKDRTCAFKKLGKVNEATSKWRAWGRKLNVLSLWCKAKSSEGLMDLVWEQLWLRYRQKIFPGHQRQLWKCVWRTFSRKQLEMRKNPNNKTDVFWWKIT